ncbi:MAG: hypothetical protein PVF18_09335, partial [Anaerolineales bacterium]
QLRDVSDSQQAIIAAPEKALLDLIYLTPGGDSEEYIQSLRLQNLDQLDRVELERYAQEFGKPKLQRAVKVIVRLTSLSAAGRGA